MTKISDKLSINTVLICDDVREEISQKTTLVGVFGSHIALRAIPIRFPLFSVWMSCTVSSDFVSSILLFLESPTKRRVSRFELPPPPKEALTQPENHMNIAWRIVGLTFDEVGTYKIRAIIDDKETIIFSFVVEEAELIKTGENSA